MKNFIKIGVLLISGFILSCSTEGSENIIENNISSADSLAFIAEITEIETNMNVNMPKAENLQKAISLFSKYADLFPTDAKTPSYLLKASDFSHSLEQNSKAVAYLNRIIEDYPEYDKVESAYYNRADYLDFHLRDTVLAKQYYLEFINKFPKSDFVKSAQARLDQHFMDMDELMEMFLKNIETEAIK